MASLNLGGSVSNNQVADATVVQNMFNNVKTFSETALVQVDGSVKATEASIAENAITASKIAVGSVGLTKFDSSVAKGVITKEIRTTDTAWGTAVNCFNGITFTPVVGRLYRISFSGFVGMGTTDFLTTKSIAFVDGSNNVVSYMHDESVLPIPGAPGTYVTSSIADSFLFIPVSATPVTLNVRVWRISGDEAFRFIGSSVKQNYILVEDLGLA